MTLSTHHPGIAETPLTVAATLGKDKTRDVLIALVSGGAHIDFRNRSGLTAMHRAAIVGNAEAIKVRPLSVTSQSVSQSLTQSVSQWWRTQ